MGKLGDEYLRRRGIQTPDEMLAAAEARANAQQPVTPRDNSDQAELPEYRTGEGVIEIRLHKNATEIDVRINGKRVPSLYAVELALHWVALDSGDGCFNGQVTLARNVAGKTIEDRLPILPNIGKVAGQLTGKYLHYSGDFDDAQQASGAAVQPVSQHVDDGVQSSADIRIRDGDMDGAQGGTDSCEARHGMVSAAATGRDIRTGNGGKDGKYTQDARGSGEIRPEPVTASGAVYVDESPWDEFPD